MFKNIKQFLMAALLGCATVGVSFAIPAKPGMLEYIQPDGTVLHVTLSGDEHSSYYKTSDGYVVMPDGSGALCYATLRTNGDVVRSKVRANDVRGVEEVRFVDQIDRNGVLAAVRANDASLRMQALERRSRAKRRGVELITNYPTVGSPKALILLVEFKDIRFSTPDTRNAFNDLINKKGYDHNGATGSAYDYFYDNSRGLFTPDFQVYGPITLDQNEAYYGAAEGQAYDKQAWFMVTDACTKLHEQNPELDWSQFDNDGDGFVDNVFVFYAGYGQNSGAPSWTIWPHAANVYTYYGINLEFNGVKVGNYACTNELLGTTGTTRTGIGTFCHEFSHILGLPDLYSTNNSGSFTPGTFELMDVGPYNNNGNTPPNMSAYDRQSVGWMKLRDLSGPETVALEEIGKGEAVKIPTAKAEEFFILENRQQTGWDKYIEGHGMLIWHIDYDPETWSSNTVNNSTTHMGVDIVEADNVPSAGTRGGDPFPGTSRVTTFTSTSTPAMRTWIGVDPEMPVTDIRETDGVITFKVKGGGDRLEAVAATAATDITATSFVAHWNGRPEIPVYELDLCRGREVVPMATYTVKGATEYKITGLTASTDYRYVVRAVDGDRKSADSNEIGVRTGDPTFDMMTAKAYSAINVYGTAFTARWEAMAGADGYELEVYSKNISDPTKYTADFTAVGSSTDLVPDGWYTNSTSTLSLSGYYGAARPSLNLSNNGAQVMTPVFSDDINYVQFWYRGRGTSSVAHIDVEGLVNNAWVKLHSILPLNSTTGTTVKVGDGSDALMPVGVKCVRIVFRTTDGTSAAIDDIVVGAGGKYTPVYVEGYNPMSTGAVTECLVTGLRNNTTYYYKVKGVDGQLRSIASDEIPVTTSLTGGIDDAGMQEGITEIITVAEGLEFRNNGDKATVAEVYAPDGMAVARITVVAGGNAVLALDSNCVYIAKFGDAIAKIVR